MRFLFHLPRCLDQLFLPEVKQLVTHIYRVPQLRLCGAIPPLFPHIFNRVVIKCTILISLRICVVCKTTLDLILPQKINTVFNHYIPTYALVFKLH